MKDGKLLFYTLLDDREDINSAINKLSIDESDGDDDFWQGAPRGWKYMENEELEEIGLVSGKHIFIRATIF
jgi:hypothetical protein